MCAAMEDMRNKARQEGEEEGIKEGKEQQAKETAYRLQRTGMSLKDIAEMLDFSDSTVSKWLAEPQRASAT